MEENNADKAYNDYLLKKFSDYHLSPLYKSATQLGPQIAMQGHGGILIYPEPVATSINKESIFTLEILEEYNQIFGLYMVSSKNPIKKSIENALKCA